MMVNIHDAKTNFSRLIERAEQGEDIVIGRAGRPVARLVPYRESASPRRPGGWEGRVRIAPDFDELPPDVAAAFRGEPS
jgi:prevent-host-death family protein